MILRLISFAIGAAIALSGSVLRADTIQLVNGDRIKGQLVSLDEKQVILKSDSFGELKIPREKIDLISLGSKGIPDFTKAPAVTSSSTPNSATANGAGALGPLLQDPNVQQQLGPIVQQLLGPNGGADTKERIEDARRGMKSLRKDFGKSPEGDALDAYIRFFEQIAPVAEGLSGLEQPRSEKGQRQPHHAQPGNPKSAEKGQVPNGDDSTGEAVEALKPKTPATP